MFWSKTNNDKSSTSSVLDNDVDPFITDYVNSHRNYFTALLGNRILNKNTLSKNDVTVLKEAYDKAHQIRNVEIDLFWKRATYCWTFDAALITICGILFSSYFKPDIPSQRDNIILLFIGLIATIGVFITVIGQLMSGSGEYWKKNWETHISMLEPLFSGSIYSTHLVSSTHRYSIAKLNYLLFIIIQLSWLIIASTLVITKFSDNPRLALILIGVISFLLITAIVLITRPAVSENKTVEVFIAKYDIKIYGSTKIPMKKWKSLKKIFYALICILIFYFLMFLSTCFILKHGIKIPPPNLSEFYNYTIDIFK